MWVFKGEIIEHDPMAQDKKLAEADQGGGDRRPRRDERDNRDNRDRRDRRDSRAPAA